MCLLSREVPILGIKNAAVTKKKKNTALFSNNTSKRTKTSWKSIKID